MRLFQSDPPHIEEPAGESGRKGPIADAPVCEEIIVFRDAFVLVEYLWGPCYTAGGWGSECIIVHFDPAFGEGLGGRLVVFWFGGREGVLAGHAWVVVGELYEGRKDGQYDREEMGGIKRTYEGREWLIDRDGYDVLALWFTGSS